MPRFLLETARLALRPFEDDDLDELAAMFADPETMRYYSSTKTRDEALEWIRWNQRLYRERGLGLWAVEVKTTGEFAGDVGLVPQLVDGQREIEVGYQIKRSLWRRGLATEAASACRDHAFDVVGADRVISIIHPGNLASRRVAEKLGMTLEKESDVFGRGNLMIYAARAGRAADRTWGHA